MDRKEAESVFSKAVRQEHFSQQSLFSYYFSQGWMEFSLHFDEDNRLRRLYVQHKAFQDPDGVEIQLNQLREAPEISIPHRRIQTARQMAHR